MTARRLLALVACLALAAGAFPVRARENPVPLPDPERPETWAADVDRLEADLAATSRALIAVAADARRPDGQRRKAINALARIGSKDGLEFLVDHIILRLEPESLVSTEPTGEEYACYDALSRQAGRENWNVAPAILRAVDKPRSGAELWRYAYLLRDTLGVTRVSDGTLLPAPRALALVEAELAAEDRASPAAEPERLKQAREVRRKNLQAIEKTLRTDR